MGQYWQVVAPRKRETFGNWGKFQEFIYESFEDSRPRMLVNHLLVPVPGFTRGDLYPPGTEGVEDGEDISGEQPYVPGEGLGKVATEPLSLDSGSLGMKRKREASDEESRSIRKAQKIDCINSRRIVSIAISFASLPTELHDLIFVQLDLEALFCLGLTNRYFWHVGRKYIEIALISSLRGPWAGTNIICVGDYIREHPAGCLPEDQEKELQEGGDDGLRTLWDLASMRYTQVKTRFQPRVLRAIKAEIEYLPEPENSQASALVEPDLSKAYPPDRRWVLRNITKRRYIRAWEVAKYSDDVDGPHVRGRNLGAALLLLICWTSNGNSNGLTGSKGKWAGHRFDITVLDEVESCIAKGEKWKDVSAVVAKLVKDVWEDDSTTEYASESDDSD